MAVFFATANATRNVLGFIDDQKAQINDSQARTLLLEHELQKLGDPCKPGSSMGVVKERRDGSLFIQAGDATISLPDDAPFKANEIARIIVTKSDVFIEKPSQCAAQVATTSVKHSINM